MAYTVSLINENAVFDTFAVSDLSEVADKATGRGGKYRICISDAVSEIHNIHWDDVEGKGTEFNGWEYIHIDINNL